MVRRPIARLLHKAPLIATVNLKSLRGRLFYPMGSDSLFGLVGLGVVAVVATVASRIPADKHPLIHFPPEPVLLPVRSSEDNKVELVSLRKLLETRCKSLFQEFKELWWLSKCVLAYYFLLSILTSNVFSGHLQTLYCVTGNFSKNDHMWYNRYALSATIFLSERRWCN